MAQGFAIPGGGSAYLDEFLPAAGATTVTLSGAPGTLLLVSRSGVAQSRVDGHYSLSGATLTFVDAFTGSERVVVAYTRAFAVSNSDTVDGLHAYPSSGPQNGALVATDPITGLLPASIVPSVLVSISSQTLNATTATVTFSSLPQTYRALLLEYRAHVVDSVNTSDNLLVQVNGDTGANYDWARLYNSGGSPLATSSTAQSAWGIGVIDADAGNINGYPGGSAWFDGYADTSTTRWKMFRALCETAGLSGGLFSGRYKPPTNAPITSMLLKPSAGNGFASGSQFALYGLS